MANAKLTIEVSAEIARAYDCASEFDRDRAKQALALALKSSAEAASQLERILDTIGTQARERGLTEDRLKHLLDDE